MFSFALNPCCPITPREVPYHRALITQAELDEVAATLMSGWLTSGPRAAEFERRFSEYKGGRPCIATNSCTSALFLSLRALDLQPGDEVITTPMTFVATANAIVHTGGTVVFADIDRETMNIDPEAVASKIGPKTRAILPVHIGGNPCRMDTLTELADIHGLALIEDCAHAVEGAFDGQPLGTFGVAGAFSFYATKNITTGEGGMIVCRDEEMAGRLRLMSRHGVDKGTWQRMEVDGEPLYDVVMPGYKCNMSDLMAAIGLRQMDKLDEMYLRRTVLAERYSEAFSSLDTVELLRAEPRGKHALHLFLLLLVPDRLRISRGEFIARAKERGVGLSVNYTPIHLFSWYRNRFCTVPGAFPNAEYCGANVISLPFYPALSDADVDYVIEVLRGLLSEFRK